MISYGRWRSVALRCFCLWLQALLRARGNGSHHEDPRTRRADGASASLWSDRTDPSPADSPTRWQRIKTRFHCGCELRRIVSDNEVKALQPASYLSPPLAAQPGLEDWPKKPRLLNEKKIKTSKFHCRFLIFFFVVKSITYLMLFYILIVIFDYFILLWFIFKNNEIMWQTKCAIFFSCVRCLLDTKSGKPFKNSLEIVKTSWKT